MEVKVIEAKNNEIRLVEDILLIYVKDINLLRNMNKEQLVEFMFNENEIVKSLSFVREFKDSIRNCVFDIISVNELRDLIESKEVPLYSLIISTATYYKKIYLALKRNAIDEVSIECSKENFVNVISLVNNETRNVTIKCHDISLKEYSELLKDINVSNKNVKVDYQEANTPIKLNTLHNLSLFIGNIVSDINKYNLSNLEKIMYVYDIVKYRIYNKDEDNYLNNRDLDKVTSGNTIVCSGFSNLFNAILMSLDIKAMPLISKTANHQRSIVYVNDSKYDIDGIYVFDPTWDCRKKESENYYLECYNYFMMPLSRSKITAYDEISRLLEVNVKDIIKKIYGYSCNDEELMSGVFVLNELENLFVFAEIDIFNEHDDRLSSIMENYSDLVKKYNQDELSSTIFFKLLYRVRRIEFNNAVVSDIDLYDLISTVVSRELSIKRLEYDKDTSPIEKLLGLFMVEDDVKENISKNIKSLEREITPNGVGIERDTTNIKLIKTLKKINEIK